MTDLQVNKYNSQAAVKLIFENNEEAYSHFEEFVIYVTLLFTKMTAIQALAALQEEDRSGTTDHKENTRTSLVDAMMKVGHAVTAYSVVTSDVITLAKADYTRSDLEKCRGLILLERATKVSEAAAKIPVLMYPNLHITAEDITAVSNLRKNFDDELAAPRVETVIRKGATYDLRMLFRETDDILRNKLDRIIPIYQTTNPGFVKNYFDARIIVNLGKRKSGSKVITITGQVIDFETELPIAGAVITVIETGQTALTDASGNFTITIEKAGDYRLQVQKENYTTHTEDPARMEPGFEYNFDFELEPISEQ
jgi:hypothetical protein